MKKYLLLLSLLSLLPAGVFNSLAQNSNTQKQQIKQEVMKELQKIPNDPKTKKIEEINKKLKNRQISAQQHIYYVIDILLDYNDIMNADIGKLYTYLEELQKQKRQNNQNFKNNWWTMHDAVKGRKEKNDNEIVQINKLRKSAEELARLKYSNSNNIEKVYRELVNSSTPQDFMKGVDNLSSYDPNNIITEWKEFKKNYKNVPSGNSSYQDQIDRLNELKKENKGLEVLEKELARTCKECAKSIQSGR